MRLRNSSSPITRSRARRDGEVSIPGYISVKSDCFRGDTQEDQSQHTRPGEDGAGALGTSSHVRAVHSSFKMGALLYGASTSRMEAQLRRQRFETLKIFRQHETRRLASVTCGTTISPKFSATHSII